MKMVTRTIISYKHTFVKLEDNNFTKKEVLLTEKMGARKATAYLKENGMEGYALVNIEYVPVKYAMPLDTFLQMATVIDEANQVTIEEV